MNVGVRSSMRPDNLRSVTCLLVSLCAVTLVPARPGAAAPPSSSPSPRSRLAPKRRVVDGPARPHPVQFPQIDPDHVLVRPRPGPGLAARLTRDGATTTRAVPGTGWIEVATPHGTARVVHARLVRDHAVAQAEFSYVRHISTVPNDPQWSAHQASYLLPLRLDRAWDLSKGTGVKVAVIDSGVDLHHPDLAGRLIGGYNVLAPSSPPQDDNGHGTMVAGIIAADANNRRGIAGIAPLAQIMPVKVVDASGNATDPNIAAGITWARTHGAKVINLSLGGPGNSSVLQSAVDAALAANIVVVAAAGNDFAPTVQYPAAVPGVLAVSATTHSGALAAFTSYGWRIDVAAPGLDITSTALGGTDQYATESGTSFSSPIVAGTAALVRAKHPSWTQSQVATQIRDTARDVGPPGVDAAFGHGIVDPLAALGGPAAAPHPAARDTIDEPNDTIDTATVLALDTTHVARIQPETDQDWYTVSFPSAGWYEINVPTGARALDHFMDPLIEMYNAGAFQASQLMTGGPLVVPIESASSREIRVSNIGGDASAYTISVTPTVPPPAFSFPLEIDLSTPATDAAIADVTGDGRNDVLFDFAKTTAPSPYANTLLVLQQLPDRTFVPGQALGLDAGNATGLTTGDLNGDGLSDVAVPTDSGIDVFMQQVGGGLPTTPQLIAAGVKATHLAIADVDGDTNPDIVAAGSFGIRVYKGPSFNTFTTVTATSSTQTVAVGDVNGDTRPDIVTCCVNVYTQNPDHSFATASTHSVAGSTAVAVGDISGDGNADVVTAARAAHNVVRFVQNGGALGAAQSTSVAAAPHPVAIADVNQDGVNDVVVLHDFTGDPLVDPPSTFGWLPASAGGALFAERTFTIDDEAASYDANALAAGDVDSDGYPDVAVATSYGLALALQAPMHLPNLDPAFVDDVQPEPFATGVAAAVTPVVTLGRVAINVSGTTVQLVDANGNPVAANVTYDGPSKQITITPDAPLANGRYVVRLVGLRDANGQTLADAGSPFLVGPPLDETAPQTTLHAPPSGIHTTSGVTLSFTANEAATFECSLDNAPYAPCGPAVLHRSVTPGTHTFSVFAVDGAGNEDATPAVARWTYRPPPHGYWMLGGAGAIYHFGTAPGLGSPTTTNATDLDVSPSGYGYWIVDAAGHVFSFGDARWHGNAPALLSGERVTSISRTQSGNGYWLFTSRGRVFALGDAKFYGDMRRVALQGPVVDSVRTPSGRGYYMVASDGGVFGFGDAHYYGSRARAHGAPVRTLVPDPDGVGYWLVGIDGSVFGFAAAFHGSMSATRLNRPIVGMVAFGDAYLMVGADGGIFSFAHKPFYGSLGGHPPAIPIVAVAAYG